MLKVYINLLIILFLFSQSLNSFSQAPDVTAGAQLYKSNCAACHSIGGGRVVGPDLIGINQKRDEKWLIQWIQSSQALIKSGDQDAIAIYNEYNKTVMTDFAFLKDNDIRSILGYIETEGNSAVASANTPAVQAEPAAIKDTTYQFSVFDYFFFSIAAILLLVVYTISRKISRWADNIGDIYENERAFFKK